MGYNWRQVVWSPSEKLFYGFMEIRVICFVSILLRRKLRCLTELPPILQKRSGLYDQFSFGYLGPALGPDHRTLYYLTGAPAYKDNKRITGKTVTNTGEAKALENLHLVTYDIFDSRYIDRGAVFYKSVEPPLYVNSIALGQDGTIYTLARVKEKGKRVRT